MFFMRLRYRKTLRLIERRAALMFENHAITQNVVLFDG
jgi:hypothetical protein